MSKKIHNYNLEIIGDLSVSNVINSIGDFVTIDNLNKFKRRTPNQVLNDINGASSDTIITDLNFNINTGVLNISRNNGTSITTGLDNRYELLSNKGIANGYTPLNNSGKIPQEYLPAVTLTETFIVSSESEMLALDVQRGDVAIRDDENKSYILRGENPSVLSNWQELLTPTDSVISVNGLKGNVVLDLSFTNGNLGISNGNSVNLDSRYALQSHTHTLNDISNLNTTDDLPEGNSSLYYTNTRVDNRINSVVNKPFVDNLNINYNSLSNLPILNISNWNTAYNYSQIGHLPLTGGYINGQTTTSGYFKITDQDSSAFFSKEWAQGNSGWARDVLRINNTNSSDSPFRIGAYGGQTDYNYAYIGFGGYNDPDTIKITPSGNLEGNQISAQTSNGRTTISSLGVVFNRYASYIRPENNNTTELKVGGASKNSADFTNIDFYNTGYFKINDEDILHEGNTDNYWKGINSRRTLQASDGFAINSSGTYMLQANDPANPNGLHSQLLHIQHPTSDTFAHQLLFPFYGDSEIYYRSKESNWNDVVKLLHSGNFIADEDYNDVKTFPQTTISNEGWYTIASVVSSRALAKFTIREQTSGSHQAVTFYAGHMYSKSNIINVVSNSYFGNGGSFSKIRIKYGATYDGALVQVYVDPDSLPLAGVKVVMTENYTRDGWTLHNWLENEPISGLTKETEVALNNTTGFNSNDSIYSKGNEVITTEGGTIHRSVNIKPLISSDYQYFGVERTLSGANNRATIAVNSTGSILTNSNDATGDLAYLSVKWDDTLKFTYANGDRYDVFHSGMDKVLVKGGITSTSSAAFQVNGFSRMGDIYLHDLGNNDTSGTHLENSGGILKWDNNDLIDNEGVIGRDVDKDSIGYHPVERYIHSQDSTPSDYKEHSFSYEFGFSSDWSDVGGSTYKTIKTLRMYNNNAAWQTVYQYNNVTSDTPIYYRSHTHNGNNWNAWRAIASQEWVRANAFMANERQDGYFWVRRSSTNANPALHVTQQSSGFIASFRQGSGDGSTKSYIANDGSMYAPNFVLNSDIRQKDNIKPLNKIINIPYYEYTFKDSEDIRYGTIAQELEKDSPELVHTDEDGNKTVKYIDMLVAKVAELESRIKILEKNAST